MALGRNRDLRWPRGGPDGRRQGSLSFSGGPGDDRLFSGTGNFLLFGDGGDDVLRGGGKQDVMYGVTETTGSPATPPAMT